MEAGHKCNLFWPEADSQCIQPRGLWLDDDPYYLLLRWKWQYLTGSSSLCNSGAGFCGSLGNIQLCLPLMWGCFISGAAKVSVMLSVAPLDDRSASFLLGKQSCSSQQPPAVWCPRWLPTLCLKVSNVFLDTENCVNWRVCSFLCDAWHNWPLPGPFWFESRVSLLVSLSFLSPWKNMSQVILPMTGRSLVLLQ